MTKKEPPKKATKKEEPTRLHTLLEGLGILVGAIVGGLAILGVIGLIPGHQEYRPLQPVLMVVSLAMLVGIVSSGSSRIRSYSSSACCVAMTMG